MKKIISVLLAVLMVFSFCVPVFAESSQENFVQIKSTCKIPVITIYGDGIPIVDKQQNVVFKFDELLSVLGGSEEGALGEALVNILMPFLLEGVATDNWDNYYDALEKEIGEIFEEARLDESGNVWNESGISDYDITRMYYYFNRTYNEASVYNHDMFEFLYDWRIDPLENARKLKEYVEQVKALTGHDKVGIIARCLGNNVVNAYISQYGASDFQGIAFAASVFNGAEIISEPISGKFTVDGNAISRLITDLNSTGKANIDSFIASSIELLENSGALDSIIGLTKEYLYYKILEGVTSALALSTFFTWPSYWSCVTDEDYPIALNYVFGPEGSEKREKYAGLIEKLENYKTEVRDRREEIIEEIKSSGANIAVIGKYGRQIIPICASNDVIGEQFVSLTRASYGATTGTVYEPLSSEYIAEREALGLGKYISPDKQVDASTCEFPDSTWFFKGVGHSDYTGLECNLLLTLVSADRQLTVDDFEISQFVSFKLTNATGEFHNNAGYTWEKMTEENCNNEFWNANEAIDRPADEGGRLISFIITLINWLIKLFNFALA